MGHLSTWWPLLSQSGLTLSSASFCLSHPLCHILSTRRHPCKSRSFILPGPKFPWDFSSLHSRFTSSMETALIENKQEHFLRASWAKAGGIGGKIYRRVPVHLQLQPQSSSLFSQIRPHTKKYLLSFKRTHSISLKTFLFFLGIILEMLLTSLWFFCTLNHCISWLV